MDRPARGATAIYLVAIPTDGYGRGVWQGIHEFGMSRPDWYYFGAREVRADMPGAIGYFGDGEKLRALREAGVPVVTVSAARREVPVPRVQADDHAVGRLAAEHLMGLGLRHFACIRPFGLAFSDDRHAGFAGALAEAGLPCEDLVSQMPHLSHDQMWALLGDRRRLGQWMRAQPLPAGVFTVTDAYASRVADAARINGLHVPEDVAIIGADNDELICEYKRPSLSTVPIPGREIGYQAAALLARLLAGEPPPDQPVVVPPHPVIARESTGVLAIADAEVAAAMRFIADHATEPITAADVLAAVPLSRRALEQRFADVIGSTPTQEIRRRRIDHAKKLLLATDLPVDQVARLSGFTDHRHLSRTFARDTGIAPTAFRAGRRPAPQPHDGGPDDREAADA